MTDGTTKGGEDYEVTEEHPDETYEDVSEHQHHEPTERRGRGRMEYRDRESTTYGSRRESDEEVSKRTAEIWAGGSTVEAVCGAGAIALTILGLVGVLPVELLSIATIAVGVGMFFAGATIAAKFQKAVEATSESKSEKAALSGGVSTEVIGGIGGAVLGILALLGISPLVLIPAAAITLGGAAFFGAGATEEMKDVSFRRAGGRRSTSAGIAGAAGMQVFIGLGAAALGILALAGMAPLTLSMVGILALGASMLLSGAAVGGYMMKRMAG